MRRVLIGLVCGLAIPALAQADLTVREKFETSGMMGMFSAQGTETNFIKGDKMRSEIETKATATMPGMPAGRAQKSVSLLRLDKGLVWFLNDEDSTYVEIELKSQMAKVSKDVNVKIKDVSIKRTGQTKDIVGYKCEKVIVDVATEVAVDGKPTLQKMQMVLWMAPPAKELAELRKVEERAGELMSAGTEQMPMADAMKAVWDKMKDIEGVTLGFEMTMANPMGMSAEQSEEMKQAMKMMNQYMRSQQPGTAVEEAKGAAEEGSGNQIRMVREAVSISTGAVSDGLFELPKGYKKSGDSFEDMYKSMGVK